ncbi:MAG: CHAT domain-containing protein [Deltaproteobacteria bacterium]|nr:CHAT domain-containing protein [Deltaproteobacteria bacterium]
MNLSLVLHEGEILCTLSIGGEFLKGVSIFNKKLIEEISQEIFTNFSLAIGKNRLENQILKDIKACGEQLTSLLLPREIIKNLAQARGNLTLTLDEGLFNLPWELLVFDNEFALHRFYLGRILVSESSRRKIKKGYFYPLDLLIVVSDPDHDLSQSWKEGENLFNQLGKEKKLKVRYKTNPGCAEMKKYIKQYDLIHYIGHLVDDGRKCGWKLHDGILGASQIREIGKTGSMPWLVFSHSCGGNNHQEGLEFAKSWLSSNTRHYIGTLYDLIDQNTEIFPAEFYRQLLKGSSFGRSLNKAREIGIAKDNHRDPNHLLYFYCGYPEAAIFSDKHFRSIEELKSGNFLGLNLSWIKNWLAFFLIIITLIGLAFGYRYYKYFATQRIQVVLDKNYSKKGFNRKILFQGFSTANEKEDSKWMIEQCYLKHLSYLPAIEVLDGRDNREPNSAYMEIKGRISRQPGGQFNVFLIVHRTRDNRILYIDDYKLEDFDENQCIKFYEWLKKEFYQ